LQKPFGLLESLLFHKNQKGNCHENDSLFATLVNLGAQQYNVFLDPAQDGGGARTGTGTVALSLSGQILTLSGSFAGLSGNANAAHIHGPSGPFPQAAGVLYDLGGMTTFGSSAGNIGPGNVTLVDKGGYTVSQQVSDLNNQRWYINVHSTTFPGGEIRGQIVLVPEPSTIALAVLGAGGLLLLAMRRHGRNK
jgi:hypothetical protein